MNLIIGSHVSFLKGSELLGSVKETINNGANAFMIYTGSNQSSIRNELDINLTREAWDLMKKNNISLDNVIVHAPFIVNLANNKDVRKWNFYIEFMKQEIERCKILGINKLVFHPGSTTDLSKEIGLNNIISGINKITEGLKDFNLLIEYMSGKGTEIGSSIEELSYIFNYLNNKECVGICIDTCHMNDSGIDINKFDEFLDKFDKQIGLDKIKCIHINDSLNNLGTHKDRHANIGYGTIGFDSLLKVVYNQRLSGVVKILETPFVNGVSPYKYEIENFKNKSFDDFVANL